jgi:hypothetical protein
MYKIDHFLCLNQLFFGPELPQRNIALRNFALSHGVYGGESGTLPK